MLREAVAAYRDQPSLAGSACLDGFVQCPGDEVWPRFYDWLTRTYRCSFKDWDELLPLPPDFESAWERERERGALRLIPEFGAIGRAAEDPGIIVRL